MRTKIEILEARAENLRREYVKAVSYIEGLKDTPFGHRCGGCTTMLETEYDFANHFLIPDERFLNLGDCPENPHQGERLWK